MSKPTRRGSASRTVLPWRVHLRSHDLRQLVKRHIGVYHSSKSPDSETARPHYPVETLRLLQHRSWAGGALNDHVNSRDWTEGDRLLLACDIPKTCLRDYRHLRLKKGRGRLNDLHLDLRQGAQTGWRLGIWFSLVWRLIFALWVDFGVGGFTTTYTQTAQGYRNITTTRTFPFGNRVDTSLFVSIFRGPPLVFAELEFSALS
jgi:hypothetical protein